MKYSIAIAGSTAHTRMCAQALLADERFEISWILTPEPKPIGRKKILTKNALHLFAEEKNIPVILLKEKIDENVKAEISNKFATPVDFLLVVDFGYLVPKWLLEFPKIAPLNIHPSLLPRWRGSSPGQFVLLYGEKESAVTLMIMGEGLDTGPIVFQEKFLVNENWNQSEYYQHSFGFICPILADKIFALAEGKNQPQPQAEVSPTPIARRFTKDDGFVSWEILQEAMNKPARSSQKNIAESPSKSEPLDLSLASPLLFETYQQLRSWPQTLCNAVRALTPWPGLWTIIPTTKGELRMQILATSLSSECLQIETVKIEGQTETSWEQAKNSIV